MNVTALKTYRCGEKGSKSPPAAIDKLMVKHLGSQGRIFVGGAYPKMADELAKALIKDGSAVEA